MAEEETAVASEVDDQSEFEAAFNEIADAVAPDPVEIEEEIEEEDAVPALAAEVDDDPYAGMTDEVKAKFEALETDRDSLKHTLDSDAGRVRAYQQQVTGLTDEITKIRAGATSGPTMSQISEAMVGGDDDWTAFSTSYPDVASAIDKRMEKLGKATETAVEQTLAPVKEQTARDNATAAKNANAERVAQVAVDFPTWTDAVKTTEFEGWLTGQPMGVAQLADSDDPRDASTLIGLYDSHLVANGKPTLKADPPTGVDEVPLTPLEKKRAQQLEDGAAPPSKKSGVNTDGPETTEFEAAFEVFARKQEQKRA
jgi:hypothetical protein